MGNTFTTSEASGTTSFGMTVATARQFVRDAGQGIATTAQLDNTTLDRALYATLVDYSEQTQCLRSTASLSLAAGAYALPTLPSDFLPARLLLARLESTDSPPLLLEPSMEVMPWDALIAYTDQPDATQAYGQPRYLAFDTISSGRVTPYSDTTAYTLKLTYWTSQPSWTFGDAGSTSLAIPEHLLLPVLRYGVIYTLQRNDPLNKSAQEAQQLYLAHIAATKNSMGMGAGVVYTIPRRR